MNGLLRFFEIVYFHHRNSQKRIIFEDAVYFITSKTHNNYPYFRERIFCELFVENLRLCKRLKEFLLYGWVLNYDHFHSQIQPNDEFNISKVMQFLKRNVSRNINFIMGINNHDELMHILTGSDNDHCRLQMECKLYTHIKIKWLLKYRFKIKYINKNPFPKFRWKKTFHDEYTRNDKSFDNHLDYIIYNLDKHNLPSDWPYVYTNPKYDDLIDD